MLARAGRADGARPHVAGDVESSEADPGPSVLDEHGVALAEAALHHEELPGGEVGDRDRRRLRVAQHPRLGEDLGRRDVQRAAVAAETGQCEDVLPDQ
ncbi:hypothetical protein EHLJMEHL_05040 [Vreelandella titanicae]